MLAYFFFASLDLLFCSALISLVDPFPLMVVFDFVCMLSLREGFYKKLKRNSNYIFSWLSRFDIQTALHYFPLMTLRGKLFEKFDFNFY